MMDTINPDSATIDVIITHKNKQKHWLELKPTGINWDSDKAFLIFASDVTLRKEAQEELNKLNLHLENRVRKEIRKVEQQQQLLIQKSKLESMGELSAGLAHEINQPLGGLSMGLDNILYKLNENELTNDYLVSKLSLLFKDIERIRTIINHVRIFSRDQQNIQKEQIEVQKIIQNSVSLIANQFHSENIKLTIEPGSEPVFIHVNQYRIEQVLLNLLSNAKYAVNKKAVLSGNAEYEKKVTIKVASKDKMMLILVEDNGIGMEEKVLCKIFDPFFSTKDTESGTGIGLSISYGIIKESNGRIRAQSVPGKGTTMIVELPKL
jgi:C4-dicarboxylate-specific signal transduction histidine kinase